MSVCVRVRARAPARVCVHKFVVIQIALCVHCNNKMCVVIMAGALKLKLFLYENLESGEKGALRKAS